MIGAFSRWLVFAPTNFQAAQDSGALTTTPGSSAGGLSDGSGSKSVPKQIPNYLYISDEVGVVRSTNVCLTAVSGNP